MDTEAHRDLQLLEAVELNARVTQRGLARQMGIALGLTNIYIKRLVRKGCIKCVNVQSNRIAYLITSRGVAEKARLTYEFMQYSLHLYKDVRRHLHAVLRERAADGQRLAIYGSGEAAELAYLSLKELGIEPVAVFDDAEGTFLGMPVRDIRDHAAVTFDLVIVASLDPSGRAAETIAAGIPAERLVLLRPHPGLERAAAGRKHDAASPRAID
jgi:DNA-binding Lrp family transcriptional regulator